MPAISIVTPLYNKADYIGETIRSVQAQTIADWEMLVVDNGSTDGGAQVARTFQDPRLHVLTSPRQGPGAARNYGIRAAQGEWIQFLDADDWLAPDQLEQQLTIAAQHPEAMIVAGGWQEVRETALGNLTRQRPAGQDEGLSALRDAAFAFPPWAVHAAIVRRAILTEAYLWPEELDCFSNEDAVFWFRLVMTYPTAFSPATGAFYRMQTPTARNQLDDPAKRLREFDLAAEYNQRWLTGRGQHPTAGQAAALMRAYSSVYEAAIRANDPETARAALARAEQWLAAYFAVAPQPDWPMRLRRWLGLPRFLRYRRFWPA
ncbi:glycosyltransferase family 2 protein [Chloracidobacterium thermophilum]|uniref:glycosyltransferase family 2 protein n=1 Tax=Chloracidobacterium thermophilum TaxID=458033 RepID=UPI0007C877A3|nr:glycosyltransferase family 2 protein [Chloracidobacterium thermophilum]